MVAVKQAAGVLQDSIHMSRLDSGVQLPRSLKRVTGKRPHQTRVFYPSSLSSWIEYAYPFTLHVRESVNQFSGPNGCEILIPSDLLEVRKQEENPHHYQFLQERIT